MNIKKQKDMKLTGILLKDNKSNTVTGFIKQFPEVVVQGENIDDTKERLQYTFDKFLDYTYKNKNYEINYNIETYE